MIDRKQAIEARARCVVGEFESWVRYLERIGVPLPQNGVAPFAAAFEGLKRALMEEDAVLALDKPTDGEGDLETEVESLREALRWALTWSGPGVPEDGEDFEDYSGATRLAWPDNPEEWA